MQVWAVTWVGAWMENTDHLKTDIVTTGMGGEKEIENKLIKL